MPPEPDEPKDENGKVCRSPVSGIVVGLFARPGQRVDVGNVLLIIEEKKTNTRVTAPCSGTISLVLVSPGDAVHAGQVLLKFE
jgi:biotin carboxyl carrier protein